MVNFFGVWTNKIICAKVFSIFKIESIHLSSFPTFPQANPILHLGMPSEINKNSNENDKNLVEKNWQTVEFNERN